MGPAIPTVVSFVLLLLLLFVVGVATTCVTVVSACEEPFQSRDSLSFPSLCGHVVDCHR